MDEVLHAKHDLEEHQQPEEEEAGVIEGWLGVVMNEYRTLRAEVIHSLALQQSCLVFGTLALGGLALAGFREWSDAKSRLPLLIFLVLVPLVSYVNGCVWLGEYARTARAGAFLAEIEDKVNEHFGRGDALTWERWLRTPRKETGRVPQFAWNSWTIFSFFVIVVPGSSAVIGWRSGPGRAVHLGTQVTIGVIEAIVFLGAIGLLGGVFVNALHFARGDDAVADKVRRIRERARHLLLLVTHLLGNSAVDGLQVAQAGGGRRIPTSSSAAATSGS
ncbi:MAG TPA: hypothetical protein VMT59_14045 [Gaiellaceae bacterium]|nr:hypothetical protein [Gaiellaceae bacterium]